MAAAFVAQPTPQNELPECCRTGFLFAGTPTGTETKYGEIDTYVAAGADKGSKKVIVIFTDAFGWKFSNTRIVADAFAQGTGFNVYVPDLMAGTAVDFVEVSKAADPRTIWGPWLQANGDSKAIPLVDAFLAALKEAEQPAKVAAIGYCCTDMRILSTGNNRVSHRGRAICHDRSHRRQGRPARHGPSHARRGPRPV